MNDLDQKFKADLHADLNYKLKHQNMDIHIETKDYLFNEWFTTKSKEIVNKTLSKYGFIKKVQVMLKPTQSGKYSVKTLIDAPNSNPIISESEDENALTATKNSIQKLRKSLEKYKVTHYHK